jgi:hypothetical protein
LVKPLLPFTAALVVSMAVTSWAKPHTEVSDALTEGSLASVRTDDL